MESETGDQASLSRLNQLREIARRRALEELQASDSGQNSYLPSVQPSPKAHTYLEGGSDVDDDFDLPDGDLEALEPVEALHYTLRHDSDPKASSSSRSPPGIASPSLSPLPLLDLLHQDETERLQSSGSSTPHQKIQSSGTSSSRRMANAKDFHRSDTVLTQTSAGRSRRSTARTTPYSFKLSLQRPSNTRQALLDAKHSAAVKAKIIPQEEYQSGSRSSQAHPLAKMIREKRREDRLGISGSSLQRVLSLLEQSQTVLDDESIGRSPYSSGPEETYHRWSDEDSTSSESELDGIHSPNTSNPFQATNNMKELDAIRSVVERHQASVTSADEFEGTETTGLSILLQDQQNIDHEAKRSNNSHFQERNFWSNQSVWCEAVRPFDCSGDNKVFSIIHGYMTENRLDGLASFFDDDYFLNEFEKVILDPGSSHTISDILSWALEIAIVQRTCKLSYSILRGIRVILSVQGVRPRMLLPAFQQIFSKLHALPDKIDNPNIEAPRRPEVSTNKAHTNLSMKERQLKMNRFFQIVEIIIEFMKIDAATGETLHFCKLLFFWLLNILIDPIHHKAKARVLPILSHLLTIVMTSGWNADRELSLELVHKYGSASPSTKSTILSCLPSWDLRTRTIVRNTAFCLLVPQYSLEKRSSSTDTHEWPLTIDLDQLLSMLSSHHSKENPLWIPRDAELDTEQLEGTVKILLLTLTDLALHLVSQELEDKPPKGILAETLAQYWSNGACDFVVGPHGGSQYETMSFRVSLSRVNRVRRIAMLLQRLNSRIKDNGTSNVMARQTRAKDLLQRTSLLILYHLKQLGFGLIDRIAVTEDQMLLTPFLSK